MSDSNLDILITRVIDHRASPADWVELEALGAANPSVWRELAMAQKDEAALSGAVTRAVGAADHVNFPAPGVPAHRSEAGVQRRLRLVATWGGWAAAAAVAIAAVSGQLAPKDRTSGINTQEASPLPLSDLLDSYLAKGQQEGKVLGQLPDKVVLDSTKTADGKTEIVFIRQIVERARVDDLYRATQDEAGNVRTMKVQLKVSGRKDPL